MADKVSRIVLTARNDASREVEKLSLQMQTFDKTLIPAVTKSLAKWAAGFVAIETAMRAVGAGAHFMVDAVKASMEAEKVQAGLEAAVRKSGQAYALTTQALRAHQRVLQATTLADDEQVAAIQSVLISVGRLSGPALHAATEATLDLAAGLGIAIPEAAEKVARAAAGNVRAFTQLGFSFREGADAGEKFSSVMAGIEQRFGGRAAAQAETTAASLERLAKAWGNLKESVGGVLIKSGDVKLLEDVAKAMQEISDRMESGQGLGLGGMFAAGNVWEQLKNAQDARIQAAKIEAQALAAIGGGLSDARGLALFNDQVTEALDHQVAAAKARLEATEREYQTRQRTLEVEKQLSIFMKEQAAAIRRGPALDAFGRPIEPKAPVDLSSAPLFKAGSGPVPDFTSGIPTKDQVGPEIMGGVEAAKAQEELNALMERTNEIALSVSSAIGDWAIRGQDFGDVMQSVTQMMLQSLLDMGIKALAQHIVSAAAAAKLQAAQNTARIGELAAQTFGAAFASTAAIPIVGPALAPAVAAASEAAMLAGAGAAFGAGAAAGAGMGAAAGFRFGGIVDGPAGTDAVPIRATRGEGILTPQQTEAVLDGRAMLVRRGSGMGGDTFHLNFNGPTDKASTIRWFEDNFEGTIAAARRGRFRGKA